MANKMPPTDSEITVLLMGVAAMLLSLVLYIALGFAPDM